LYSLQNSINYCKIFLLSIVVPSAPISVKANVTGSRNATVSWQEGALQSLFSSPILDFEVYLNGSLHTTTNSTTAFLNFLTPFTNYKVTVTARNRVGISSMSDPVLFMTKEEGKLYITKISILLTCMQFCTCYNTLDTTCRFIDVDCNF